MILGIPDYLFHSFNVIAIIIFGWLLMNRRETLSIEKEVCKHTGYSVYRERGFGARPYLRCSNCNQIVEDI